MISHCRYHLWILLSLSLFGLTACEKVIDLDIKTSSAKLVVEGVITDAVGPYTVKLSKTGSYFNASEYPAVQGATVIISDTQGSRDTLRETSPGNYQTRTLQGMPGRTYFLSVWAEGQVYTAQSTMPQRVILDSLGQEYGSSSLMEDEDGNTKGYRIKARFQDPVGVVNYYRLKLYFNGVYKDEQMYLQKDNLSDGKYITYDLRSNLAQLGQQVKVELLSIDKATYDYYNTLNTLNGGGFASAVPDNPTSNISQGALGYFGAIATSTRERAVSQ